MASFWLALILSVAGLAGLALLLWPVATRPSEPARVYAVRSDEDESLVPEKDDQVTPPDR